MSKPNSKPSLRPQEIRKEPAGSSGSLNDLLTRQHNLNDRIYVLAIRFESKLSALDGFIGETLEQNEAPSTSTVIGDLERAVEESYKALNRISDCIVYLDTIVKS